jgi:hypothetical protein
MPIVVQQGVIYPQGTLPVKLISGPGENHKFHITNQFQEETKVLEL